MTFLFYDISTVSAVTYVILAIIAIVGRILIKRENTKVKIAEFERDIKVAKLVKDNKGKVRDERL